MVDGRERFGVLSLPGRRYFVKHKGTGRVWQVATFAATIPEIARVRAGGAIPPCQHPREERQRDGSRVCRDCRAELTEAP